MAYLSLRNISKRFGDFEAVKDVSLEIEAGEFFSILGPSGCGKTTLLRMIAGFESPTSGTIMIDGNDLTHVRPQDRAIGMVFQNYALFPHMTVFENVAFGLETRHVPKDEIRKRVERILETVHLSSKPSTPVPHLSGGEQQRVAVARALVVEPGVLLFDEPLSNLDVALRVKTREEIRIIQRKTNITTIYVTHDQSEAMSLSDRIAVMRTGRIEQVGSPAEIYEFPVSSFVAGFVGGANLLRSLAALACVDRARFDNEVPAEFRDAEKNGAMVSVKPEAFVLFPNPAEGLFHGEVMHKEYLGFVTNFVVGSNGMQLHMTAMTSGRMRDIKPGQQVGFTIDWPSAMLIGE